MADDFEVSNGFDNFRAKIGRAYKHLKEFDALYVEYCRHKAYTVSHRDDVVNGRHVRRCEFNTVPSDVSLSLSDAMYSLRSGLDQIAWQLALLRTKTPSRNTSFPIYSERNSDVEKRFRNAVWDLPCEAIKVIEDLQPYTRGAAYRDDPLWQLNELSNLDKHRIPVGRATGLEIYFEPRGGLKLDLDYGVEVSWPLALKDSVIFEPKIPELTFGDPLDCPASVPLELRREDIARIYSYVRETVAPRFTSFFSAPPYPES